MNISKYWKDMHISKPENPHPKKLIISKEEPVPFPENYATDLKDKTQPMSKLSKEEKDELIKFINANYQMDQDDNIETIDADLLQRFENVNGQIIITRYTKTGRIMGCMFSVVTPLRANLNGELTEIAKHGYTTFMTVHKKLRKKGVCMMLIRGMVKYGYKDLGDVFCGYHLVPSAHTTTPVTVKSWFRPINLKKSRETGFQYKTFKTAKDRSDFRDKFYYRIPKLGENVQCVKIKSNCKNFTEIYQKFLEMMSRKKLHYIPTESDFMEWCKNFDTHYVEICGNIAAVFTVRKSEPFIVSTSKLANMALLILFCSADAESADVAYKCLLKVVDEAKYDVLYGYELGDLTLDIAAQYHAGETSSNLYLEFYNNGLDLKPSEVMIPLI